MLPNKLRLTRELVNRLPKRTDERGPISVLDPSDDYYTKTATDIMGQLDLSGKVWIFATGSLIWNPRMDVAERRVANVEGWRRAFCLADRRFRGSPSRPGLMMALDRGERCQGVAMRMNGGSDISKHLIDLLKKEPPIPPELVMAQTDKGSVQALVFAAKPDFPFYQSEPPLEDLADILATSVGYIGTMAEYLFNTSVELQRARVHDAHLWQLQDLVAKRLECI